MRYAYLLLFVPALMTAGKCFSMKNGIPASGCPSRPCTCPPNSVTSRVYSVRLSQQLNHQSSAGKENSPVAKICDPVA